MVTKTMYLYERAKSIEAAARQEVKHARRQIAKGCSSTEEYERVKSERWVAYNDMLQLQDRVCNESLEALFDSIS